MADAYLLENGVDRYLLEDASGVYITEAASQSVSPAAFGLTLTPVAPEVRLRATPGALNLSLTPLAPSVSVPKFVSPAALSLTLTVVAPQIPPSVRPASFSLALQLPYLATTGGWGTSGWGDTGWASGTGAMQVVVASVAPSFAFTLTPLAPTINTIAGTGRPPSIDLRILQPLSLHYWGSAWGDAWGQGIPSMQVVTPATPAAIGLSLGLPAPQVDVGSIAGPQVQPAALGLLLTVLSPSVTVPASPPALGLTLALGAPVIVRGGSPLDGVPVLGATVEFVVGGSESELVGAGATSSWGSGGNTT